MQIGSKGGLVAEVQGLLRKLGYATSDASGEYGPATAQAVERFQTESGLVADGRVRARTHATLKQVAEHPEDLLEGWSYLALRRLQARVDAFDHRSAELFAAEPEHRDAVSRLLAEKARLLCVFSGHVDAFMAGEDPDRPPAHVCDKNGPPENGGPPDENGGERPNGEPPTHPHPVHRTEAEGQNDPVFEPTLKQRHQAELERLAEQHAELLQAAERHRAALAGEADATDEAANFAAAQHFTELAYHEATSAKRRLYEELRYDIVHNAELLIHSLDEGIDHLLASVERLAELRKAWLASGEDALRSELGLVRGIMEATRELACATSPGAAAIRVHVDKREEDER